MPIAITDLSETLSSVVQSTGQSVVRVEDRRGRVVTGIVWSSKQIITVARPIDGAKLTVTVDGKEVEATYKGHDGATNLALLELAEPLTPASFDEGDTLKVGQLVLRLARPGETIRATSGILSAVAHKAFQTRRGGSIDLCVETDAPMNEGFEGGPLVDLQGRVIGLNSGSITVPTKTLRRVVASLEQHGKVRRSYLGVSLQPVQLPEPVRASTGEEIGLLVTAVEKDGPAEKAGIQYGDTVLHLGDDTVKTLQDLYAYLRADHADQQVPVKVFRNGQVVTQQVTLGGR